MLKTTIPKPFKIVSSKQIIIVGQIFVAILLWYAVGSKIIPTPDEILSTIPILWNKGLGYELYRSFLVNLKSLLIAFIISVSLAYSTVLPYGIGRFFQPAVKFISNLRFLGLIGLTLVFTLMTPNGHTLKISLLVFGITTFMVTSLYDIVSNIPKERFDDARTLRMTPMHVVWEVVVLGTAADALSVLRQCAAISWTLLAAVEGLVRTEGGLGALMLTQDKYFNLNGVFAIQFVILLVGLTFDFGIEGIRRMICPYSYLSLERK